MGTILFIPKIKVVDLIGYYAGHLKLYTPGTVVYKGTKFLFEIKF